MPTRQRFPNDPGPAGNRLLAALGDEDYASLAASLEPVSLVLRQPLTQLGQPIRHVFFPTTAICSVLVVMENAAEVEVGLVGPEGMVGLSVALGLEFAVYRTICQVPGLTWRLPTHIFREALQSRTLKRLVHRYAAVRLRQTAQMVACNTLHPATARLCRWLLMCHDRVSRDEFPMTQEFMSELLGVRRPSVSLIAGRLQAAGIITYKRGLVRVEDRRKLEEASCECYVVMKELYERILK